MSAFRLPSAEDSIECATCALQQGTYKECDNHVKLYCTLHIGQLTQLIHWIGNGSVSNAFASQYMHELNFPAVNTEYTPGGFSS